jgi:hypothetical protein
MPQKFRKKAGVEIYHTATLHTTERGSGGWLHPLPPYLTEGVVGVENSTPAHLYGIAL